MLLASIISLCVFNFISVTSKDGSRVNAIVSVAGQVMTSLPLYIGVLHPDPVMNIWKARPDPLPTYLRYSLKLSSVTNDIFKVSYKA